MEVLFHCKKMIKKVDVSQRFALKRPFARRALSNSLEKVARRSSFILLLFDFILLNLEFSPKILFTFAF